jgi:hypothetical protein
MGGGALIQIGRRCFFGLWICIFGDDRIKFSFDGSSEAIVAVLPGSECRTFFDSDNERDHSKWSARFDRVD